MKRPESFMYCYKCASKTCERKMARFHETTLVIVGEGSGNASLESSNWSLGGEEEGALLINPLVLLSF